jgi:putative transposase
MIKDIWNSVTWKEWQIPGKKQKRLFPNYQKDNAFKRELRDKYLKDWEYAAHWADSALKPAYSIINSWKKNYSKGKRKRRCPVVKRPFARVRQTLMKVEGEQLRITIKPREFVFIDLSKCYFKLNGRIGEPILTSTHIHLPVEVEERENGKHKIGWDSNKHTLDGFSPDLGWIRASLRKLFVIHIGYDNKRRRINRIATKRLHRGKEPKKKYSKRERDRISFVAHQLTNTISSLGCKHGFEDLNRMGMYKKWRKKWNREFGYADWKKIINFTGYKSVVVLVDPYHTSKDCSRCGCINKDLKGDKFECKNCGLIIDRQLNASVNIYLKMEGLPHDIGWFDENVVSRFTQTGAEWKETDELVRSLYDTMKPQVEVVL